MNHFMTLSQSISQSFSKVFSTPRLRNLFKSTQRMVFLNISIFRDTERILLRKLNKKFHKSKHVLYTQRLLLGACLFSWSHEKITDEEINKTLEDFCPIFDLKYDANDSSPNILEEDDSSPTNTDKLRNLSSDTNFPFVTEEWELILDRPDSKLWRRLVGNSSLYEYKMCGILDDVKPWSFVEVQLNMPYRREWDDFVLKLGVIDYDEGSQNEVVHWVTKMTYPLYPREYIYVRRVVKDSATGNTIIVSRSISEHDLAVPPEGLDENQMVRVTDYHSTLIIEPHYSYEKYGLNYYLTYFDDQKTTLPRFAYNYAAKAGIPQFIEQLRQAAKSLEVSQSSENNSALYDKSFKL